MKKYFIALEPEEKLRDSINNQKNTIKELVGEQKYLSDPPHITLIILTLENSEQIIEKLNEITENIQKIPLTFKDFHIFYDDIQTKGHTITYSFLEQDIERLKQIQLNVINSINKFNTKEFIQKEIYEKMSEPEKENTDKYGFPFIGENWIPHITLASIEKEKFEEVWNKIRNQKITGEFLVNSINLYEIADKPILIKTFNLQ